MFTLVQFEINQQKYYAPILKINDCHLADWCMKIYIKCLQVYRCVYRCINFRYLCVFESCYIIQLLTELYILISVCMFYMLRRDSCNVAYN